MKLPVKIAIILLVFSAFYFGNRWVQVSMGQHAVDALNFPIYTLEEGLKTASEENKLVLADYSAIWCPSCRRLDEDVFADELVAKTIAEEFIYVRLEYDSESGIAFAEKHELQGFPRVLVLNTYGEKLQELPLTFEPSTYASNLEKVVSSL